VNKVNNNQLSSYLDYCKEVLGLQSAVLKDQIEIDDMLVFGSYLQTQTGHWPAQAEHDILVIDQRGSLFSGESEDLWKKMKAAMKLGPVRMLELHAQNEVLEQTLIGLLRVYPARVILLLSHQPSRSGAYRVLQSARIFESFSPSLLVQSPDLKRQAWSDLQAVMQFVRLGAAKE
jgi:hypothetical protein